MTRRKAAQTLQLVDGALCTFADTLEVLPGYTASATAYAASGISSHWQDAWHGD